MITRRNLLIVLGAAAFAPRAVFAQSKKARDKVRRIGFLGAGGAQNDAPWLAAFREGMAELRWIEGRDYVIETRFGNNVPQAMAGLAAELVATQPDVLVAPGDGAVPALVERTRTIPIVFAIASDPVGLRFAASLQRPGGNLTGLTSLGRELSAKRLQLLKEAFPRVELVAALFEPDHMGSVSQVKDIEEAAKGLGIRVTPIALRQAADIEPAFQRGATLGVQAYIAAHGTLAINQRQALVDRVFRSKVPAIFATDMFVDAGGLMSYAPSLDDNFRRAAAYVDKILKGAKPGDLPIEQPTKFVMVINMKTAKALGLTIPQSILVRADRVIE